MGDALGKLLKVLDQMLPFLDSAPPWLRTWIYLLIFLNFVTIAGASVSYLISRQQRSESESFKHFSIDTPVPNELIPLSDSGRWMIAGNFPIIPAGTDVKHDVQVEVLRYPDRDKVPQDGSARIATAGGAWRFEQAKFPGAGTYEIVATAVLGSETEFRTVRVSCTDKASAYRQSIITERQQRGAPPIAWPQAQNVASPLSIDQLATLQNDFYQHYFVENDLTASLETVNVALNAVEPLLPLFPDNYDLQNFRAYMLKNYAMIMRDTGHGVESKQALDEAAKMFAAVRQQKPEDPGAWNGLGSVAALQGNLQLALQYIDQALFLQPGYAEAQYDRQNVVNALKAQENPPAK